VNPTIAQIADAVVAELQAGIANGLWPSMVVSRAYLHEFSEDSTDFHLSVAPPARSSSQISRGLVQGKPQLTFTFSKVVPDLSAATIDPLAAAVEAVQDAYSSVRPLSNIAGVMVVGETSSDGFYSQDMLNEKSLFVAIVTATFEAFGAAIDPSLLVSSGSFAVMGPATASAGAAIVYTVTALTPLGAVSTGYNGTVAFTSSDSLAVLPGPMALSSGVGTFTAYLETFGTQTISATDTANASITGSEAINVGVGALHFFINWGNVFVTAGQGHQVTVFATTGNGQVYTPYNGTVHFTCTDPAAILPANKQLTAGIGTVSATLRTAATRQTLTATDTVISTLAGRNAPLLVLAGAATQFTLSMPTNSTAGVAIAVSVTAEDSWGNRSFSYLGTVALTSTDSRAILPTYVALRAGRGNCSATLNTAGTQTLTATDAAASSITGHATTLVAGSGSTTPHFVLTLPASPLNSGSPFNITVTATSPSGSVVTSYHGDATLSAVNTNGVSNPFLTWPAGGFPADSAGNGGPFVNGVFVYSGIVSAAGGGSSCQFEAVDDSDPTIIGITPVISFN
jgi:hypothetical protein